MRTERPEEDCTEREGRGKGGTGEGKVKREDERKEYNQDWAISPVEVSALTTLLQCFCFYLYTSVKINSNL